MRRSTLLLGTGLLALGTLAACGEKVDRDGTRDNLVEQVEALGGTVDTACVDDVLDNYSDDELTTFDEEMQKSETDNAEAQAFVEELLTCVSAAG